MVTTTKSAGNINTEDQQQERERKGVKYKMRLAFQFPKTVFLSSSSPLISFELFFRLFCCLPVAVVVVVVIFVAVCGLGNRN